ncbi:CapA family protein [Pseudogracilibacillus auburnensis]|uniref:CapA family protein n=1 Tax=Pseudogracilibacillus auburnensis TaxID=1494959 RepID=UPI001A957C08|nr:CapA family protein [Pseudogracilibacillus auburnensis]MBO1003872.1 CapA family protein [Pseudogracilibacillus auburnensis]
MEDSSPSEYKMFIPLLGLFFLIMFLFVFENGSVKVSAQSKAQQADPEIEILFAGDTMFDWGLRPILETKGYDYPFVYIKDTVRKADYSFINAETVFTENPGTKDPDQLFWINSDLRGLQAIEDAGFNMINIGNNHTMDYMEPGLLDTLKNVKNTNMEYIGAGKDRKEAYQSKEVVLQGKNFRFFSFVRFFPNFTWVATENRAGVTDGYDLEGVKQTILEQKADADYVIVYFHWGVEKKNTPADYQKEYVKALKEVGVNLIVGSHPHWLQGFEYYEEMPVAYSLGNFLFPPYVEGRTAETGLLKAIFKGDKIDLVFDPYIISNGQIIPPEEKQKQEMLHYLQSISFDVEMDKNGKVHNNHQLVEEKQPMK